MKNTSKVILVTGGAGFIGSHLCKKLLEKNNYVICMDNLFSGRKSNIENLFENPKFSFLEHDVQKAYDFYADEIYNLACPASPPYYQKDPVNTLRTCFYGAENALNIAKKYNAKILQASTSEVYGDPLFNLQNESYWGNVNPNGIRACYDEGKRVTETLFFEYYRKFKVKIKIVRIFNTYGPNMSPTDGRVISNFITQALLDKNLTVYGEGEQSRSFCYIDDLIRGLIAMMDTSDEVTGPINLGNPHEYKIYDLAKKILELINCNSKITRHPLPEDDPRQRCPDITKAIELLGWKPEIQLDEGLMQTINYFKIEQQHKVKGV